MKMAGDNSIKLRQRGTPTVRSRRPELRALRPWPADRVEFARELMRKLDLLRREIEGLRRRLQHAGGSRRIEYADLLDALELKADRLGRQLERLAVTSGESWEVVRADAVETWSKLKRHLILVALAMHRERSGREPGAAAKRPRR